MPYYSTRVKNLQACLHCLKAHKSRDHAHNTGQGLTLSVNFDSFSWWWSLMPTNRSGASDTEHAASGLIR